MTIVVLGGGLSHEREVSLRSARCVTIALRELGHQVVESDINSDLIGLLRRVADPVVVPMLHGGLGEDGALREVFDLLDVPYVGSTASACRLAFDKSVATALVASAGGRTPNQVALPREVFKELGAKELMTALGERPGFPMMVKPSCSGSALGCTRVDSMDQLPAAMVGAYSYGEVAVIERFIEGTEIAITIVDLGDGPLALPAVEIRPVGGIYNYQTRYTAGLTQFITPASLPDEVLAEAEELALLAWRTLGLRDLGRMDLIVADDGPVFIEANLAPGMTDTSLAPQALRAAGLGLGEVFASLVKPYLAAD